MRYGLTLPIFDELSEPALLAELAAEAEAAGWDGVFVWDHVYYRAPVRAATDPWVSLAAMAVATSTIVIGPMVTPLARRRPQVVAREVAALDRLSTGRVVLGTGLGLDSSGGEFERFGEQPEELSSRAERYDEALELLSSLLAGEHVDFDGRYVTARDVRFLPRPVQEHLPIVIAARWPNRRPLERAARYDGVFVIDLEFPGDLAAACSIVAEQRPNGLDGFEVVVDGATGDDSRPWADAGATWWLTGFDPFSVTAEAVRAAIRERPGA